MHRNRRYIIYICIYILPLLALVKISNWTLIDSPRSRDSFEELARWYCKWLPWKIQIKGKCKADANKLAEREIKIAKNLVCKNNWSVWALKEGRRETYVSKFAQKFKF